MILDVTNLVRTQLNDTFPGLVNGVLTPGAGRVFTDDNPAMLPALNSSLRTLMRKLRIANVTFPTKEAILYNLTPVQNANPGQLANSQVYIGFEGYFDGLTLLAQPALPQDCMSVNVVWEQDTNSSTGFKSLDQPGGGIVNTQQSSSNRSWEWRRYRVYMPGATNVKNLKIRYSSGQPPLNVPAEDFESTSINILDCQDALAYLTAAQLARARGAADVTPLEAKAQDAIEDMIRESVRRNQAQTYRRQQYGNDQGSVSGGLL
jgi:hypothetical protein